MDACTNCVKKKKAVVYIYLRNTSKAYEADVLARKLFAEYISARIFIIVDVIIDNNYNKIVTCIYYL